MVLDLFGEEIVHVSALSVRNLRGYKGGYASRPGSGPKGERCGTCRHDVRLEGPNRNYHKCALCKPNWTHGAGSDIKMKTPACAKWERRL